MKDGVTHDLEEEGGGNIGLAFNKGFFFRTQVAENENTSEIMSYVVPEYGIFTQAFLVDDFAQENEYGFEVIPDFRHSSALIRIDKHLWDFIEDVADTAYEETLYKGMLLGELLVGSAHRIIVERSGQLPPFI